MTTQMHTDVTMGAPATAAVLNAPLGQLDRALSDVLLQLGNFITFGGLAGTSGSLVIAQPATRAFIQNTYVQTLAQNLTMVANNDNYIDLDSTGTYHITSVANGAPAPGVFANSLRLSKAVAGASTVTAVVDLRSIAIFPTNVSVQGPRPWVDPLHPSSGGIGDGFADDTNALISAVGKLPANGGTLFLAPGTSWLISSQVLFNALTNVTVWAFGATLKLAATLAWGTTQRYGLLFQDCTNPRVLGLTLDENGAALKALPQVGWFVGIAFASSIVDITSTTVKSFNCWVEDCVVNNVRSFGIGFRLTDGCHVKRVRGNNAYNDANAGLFTAFVVGTRVSNFDVSDDCDFDGGGVCTAGNSVIGVLVSPGNGSVGQALWDGALNSVDLLNYIQPASFVAPAAAQATSTVQVAYGALVDPVTAPVTADGGAGALPAGTYQITYSYLNLVGETKASGASIGLVLGASHQIAVSSIAGIPNGVYAVKIYITAPAGQAGFALQVPVVANATGAFNVNNVGNGVASPAANGTAPNSSGMNGLINMNALDWFFLCQTPGSGANAGIVPGDDIKVSAIDTVNKLVTFQRFDGSENAGVAMSWAGQKVWVYGINTSQFCRDISVSDSSFKNLGVPGASNASGAFFTACKDFKISDCRAWNVADICYDAEHCMRGSISDNVSDNPGCNTGVGILFFIQDVSVTDNVMSRGTAGVLQYSGWALAGNIVIDGNTARGNVGASLAPAYGATWDQVLDGMQVTNNTFRVGSNFGGTILSSACAVQLGRNPTGPRDVGGYMRDVTVRGNRFEGATQRPVLFSGIDGINIVDNESEHSGYGLIGDANTFQQSFRIFIDGNILNNTGYRSFGGTAIYYSNVTPVDPPRIGGRNQWRNSDPTLNGTQPWYMPANVAAHPTGLDNLLLGSHWYRVVAGVLQVSTNTTTGTDGTWASIADLLGLNAAWWTIPDAGATITSTTGASNPNLAIGPVPGGGSGNAQLILKGKSAGVVSQAYLLADYSSGLHYDVPTGNAHVWSVNSQGTTIATLDANGNYEPRGRLYPGDQALGAQTSGGLLHATGVPSNANGNNNDFCISDNGRLYFRAAGVWAAFVNLVDAQTFGGAIGFSGGISSDLIPTVDNTDKLGTAAKRYSQLFVGDGGVTISSVTTGLVIATSGTNKIVGTIAGLLESAAQIYPGAETLAIQTSGGLLHSTGVPSNANGNNNDFCISDNGNVYFRSAGTWGVVAHPSVNSQATPGNPAGTASTVGVMMGLAGAITPKSTGTILVILSGDMLNATAIADGAAVQLRYGTGGAPGNAAVLAGTAVGNKPQYIASTVLGKAPFAIQAIISGLAVGTAVWLDASLAAITGGTAVIENLSLSAVEI